MKQYEPSYLTLREVFDDKLFLVPVYQRPYAWESLQTSTIIDDLINAFKLNKELFTGTIYLKKTNVKVGNLHRYEIIDGQQRLTTFSIILLCLYALSARAGVLNHYPEFGDIKSILWKDGIDFEDNIPLIELGSVERNLLLFLFNSCFEEPLNFNRIIKEFESDNSIETNLMDAVKKLYDSLLKRFSTMGMFRADELREFVVFFLNKVTMIFIETNTSRKTIFEMFEAINSKGKQLEEIDLIKLFIFSNLEQEDFDEYLEKWGYLLKETNNELGDYLWIYIKAYFKFYKTAPNARHFKILIEEITSKKLIFHSTQHHVVLKRILDSLTEYVNYYRCLDNRDSLLKYTSNPEVVLQMNIYQSLKYEHIRPIIFRAIKEHDERVYNGEDREESEKTFLAILKSANSFMVQFQSLSKMESKYTIPTIKNVLTSHYKLKQFEPAGIYNQFQISLATEHIDEKRFLKEITQVEAFRVQFTELGFVFLVIDQAFNRETGVFNYALANYLFENRRRIIGELVLPKEPPLNSGYYYLKKVVSGEEVVKLQNGHDFPISIQNGMPYELFAMEVLSKLGNVQMQYKPTASKPVCDFPLHYISQFNTYSELKERTNQIAESVVLSQVFNSPVDIIMREFFPSANNLFRIDFDKSHKATYSKPVLVKINGEEYEPSSHRDVAQFVLDYLYDYDSKLFDTLVKGRRGCGTWDNPWFSTNKDNMNSPREIKGSPYYFNANKSAVDLLTMMTHVFSNIYEFNLKDLEIYCRK